LSQNAFSPSEGLPFDEIIELGNESFRLGREWTELKQGEEEIVQAFL